MAINNTVKFNLKPISASFKQALTPYKVGGSGNIELKSQSVAKPTQNAFVAPKPALQPTTVQPQKTSLVSTTPTASTAPKATVNTPTNTKATKGLVAPVAPTYSSIVSNITKSAKPTNVQTGLVQDLRNTAQGNKAIAEQARQLSEQYGGEIARIGNLGAGAQAGLLSTGTSVVGSGNAAIASQSASARMNALAQAQDAALKGTGQQLTAQEQTAGAFGQALGGANTQQSQLLGGLESAGGLAQPVQVAPGSTLASPITGEQVAGGLGGYVNYQTAEQVMGLISQYPDAGYSYNQNLTPQQNLQSAQQAIQGSPNYQRATFGSAGATSPVGAAGVQAAQALTGQVAEIQAVYNGAEANFDLAINTAKRAGVNNLNQPALNQLQNNVNRGLTSNSDLVSFKSLLGTVRAQYATILGGGTSTDSARAEANEIIPDNISLKALEDLSKNLKTDAQNRIAGLQSQINAYGGQQGSSSFAEEW